MNIDMDYIKKFLVEILDISSCGGCTDTAIARLVKEMDYFGVKNRITNKGAMIGTIQGECDTEERMVSAHIDTLGAIVKDIKPNGRLKVTNIGGFAWQSVEGENVIIKTSKGKEYSGTMLPEKASIHIHSDEVRESARTEDTMEIRIDENTCTKQETEKFGIRVGDFVNFETRTRITDNGYIKSRYLDDKACVAVLFGIIKYLKDNNLKLKYTTHFYFSNYEEIGHGISVIPEKVKEFVALDIGTVGIGHTSDEHCVTILAKDSRTPYDFSFREKLVQIAESNKIDYRVDVHFRYGSDASVAVLQGFDTNFACIGMGVDATHHYERTHVDGILNTTKLLVNYLCKTY